MALSAKDAFKVGFLSRCVESGLDPAQMLTKVSEALALVEKHAGIIGDVGGLIRDAGKGVADATIGYGAPMLAAAPPILGGMAGYGLARATDIDDRDIDEIKNQELVESYRRQSHKLQRQKAVRDFNQSRKTTGRVFM